jgi:hypothetical protein
MHNSIRDEKTKIPKHTTTTKKNTPLHIYGETKNLHTNEEKT